MKMAWRRTVEVTAGTVYTKEPGNQVGYKLDTTVRSLKVEAGKTAVLNVSDVPVLMRDIGRRNWIDMETGKATAQGNAALSEQSLPGIIMTDFIQKITYQRKQHVPGLQKRWQKRAVTEVFIM